MKEFIKKNYSILIPAFLIIVILIAVILYAREYKNNRYANNKDVNVYQYFSGSKMEYVAKIGRNRKNVLRSWFWQCAELVETLCRIKQWRKNAL